MTYCVAIKLAAGLVFASDSRTHAGVDHVSSYSKMHAFSVPGERMMVVLSAGNLATTQAVINILTRDMEDRSSPRNLRTVDYMFDAAAYIGEISCKVQSHHCDNSKHPGTAFEASFIIGGQIAGKPPEILMIYPEGNYISASPSNPFLQIGETKYGKPVLDRMVTLETSLADAARAALVSFDSTMRSNVSVGHPIELGIYKVDSYAMDQRIVLEADSPFYQSLRVSWGDGLRRVFDALPRFDWE